MSEHTTRSSEAELEHLSPRNDAELRASASAVHRERLIAEGDALIEALTPRERMLIEAAWWRGARREREQLREAIASPCAATLDAGAVRSALDRPTQGLPGGGLFPPHIEGWHYYPALVELVREVDRRLEHEGSTR